MISAHKHPTVNLEKQIHKQITRALWVQWKMWGRECGDLEGDAQPCPQGGEETCTCARDSVFWAVNKSLQRKQVHFPWKAQHVQNAGVRGAQTWDLLDPGHLGGFTSISRIRWPLKSNLVQAVAFNQGFLEPRGPETPEIGYTIRCFPSSQLLSDSWGPSLPGLGWFLESYRCG